MKLASRPARVPVPFADQGTKNAIPVNSQIGVKDGAASYTDGFPPLTMTPIAAGGIPPAGGDFNGILNAITQSVRWACAGGQYAYDGAFSTAIGGYPKGALIQNAVGDVIWLNTADDNKTNPDTGTGWSPAIRYGLTTVALAGSNVTLTPAQAAKETIVLTGALTANVQLIMPAWVETWLIVNNTTGNFTVSVKPAAGSGVNLAASTSSQVYGDGTNIYYGALMVRNNLAEIKAAGTNSQTAARGNIGCGTVATKDVTTSSYDTTAGRVQKVGDYGQGTATGLTLLNSIFDIACTGKYSALGVGAGASATQGMPANSGNTRFSVEADNIYTGQYWVTLRSTSQIYLGLVNTTNKTASWTQYYTELNKPTATDVDAVSASQGGVFQGQVQFSQGLRLQNAEYLAGVAYGSDAASFSGANLLLKSWYGIGFYSNYPSSGELGIMGYINVRIGRLEMKEQIIPGNYANFDARYQAKGNYTPAGQAYTKAESDGRFQKINTASKAGSGWYKDTNTGMIIQWGSGSVVNTAISFPIAFPSNCAAVQITDAGTGRATFSATRSNSGMTIYTNGSNPVYSWIAIGY